MVAEPGHWPWSSYGAMLGQVCAPTWLETDWLLASALGVPSHALILEGERPVSVLQAEQAWSFLRRRAAREPLQ